MARYYTPVAISFTPIGSLSGRVIVSEKESDSHWQQNDYKGFSPSTDWDTVDFTKSPAIQELPVISAICKPLDGQTVQVEDGTVLVKGRIRRSCGPQTKLATSVGYAWSGGGQKIIRVDVTTDGGNTWHVANLDHQDSAEPPQHWSWTLWSVRVPIKPGTTNVNTYCRFVIFITNHFLLYFIVIVLMWPSRLNN
jgi:sulfite oxidase